MQFNNEFQVPLAIAVRVLRGFASMQVHLPLRIVILCVLVLRIAIDQVVVHAHLLSCKRSIESLTNHRCLIFPKLTSPRLKWLSLKSRILIPFAVTDLRSRWALLVNDGPILGICETCQKQKGLRCEGSYQRDSLEIHFDAP